MLRKQITWMLYAALLIISKMVWAQTGDLFTVSSSGTPGFVQISICLNGKGPTSCENHTASNFSLSIKTNIANHTYRQVGIKLITPTYGLTGCNMYSNGYCIFTTSDTNAANVTITPPTDTVSLTNINPSSGPASGGTSITLTGTNLSGATNVTIGGIAATYVNVVNATTVTAVTPSHATGAVDVVITTPNGSATLTSGYTYNTTAVGQSSGGGKIACLGGGLNNLIAASTDNSTSIEWGGSGIATGAASTTDGATNTTIIVTALGAGTTYAAGLCDAYEIDSQGNTPCQAGNACYNDWFLPALDQLSCLETNKLAIGGFDSSISGNYWGSSEFNALYASLVGFLTGGTSYTDKPGLYHVRCVRAFTP